MTAIVSIFFPAMLLAAAAFDVSSFKIPNRLTALMVVAWPICAMATDMTLVQMGWAMVAALVVLMFGFSLFAAGLLGGGDAKLMAAVVLYTGASLALPFVLRTTIAGASVAIMLTMFRRFPLPQMAMEHQWIMQLYGRSRDMPYAVAIAIGGLTVWPMSAFYLF